jgi:hypothetical protein
MTEANALPEQSFSVLRGNPTPEELAVVVALLQAASASAAAGSTGTIAVPVSSWSRNFGLLRVPITPGYGQWRAAYRRGLTR